MNDAFAAQLLRFPTHLVVDQSSNFKADLDREFKINREQAEFFNANAFAGQRTQSC